MSINEMGLNIMADTAKVEVSGEEETKLAEHVPTHPGTSRVARVRSFVWHLLQMVLAMEAGMGVYSAIRSTVLADTGFYALTKAYPLLGYWMMVVAMTLPMIALMRYYHRASWRYCLEMAAAMAAPAVGLTILVQVGLLPAKPFLGCGISDPLMVLAMAGYMLLRPGTHEHGNSSHQQDGSCQRELPDSTEHRTHENS